MPRKIGTVFAAAVISMFFMNELQLRTNLSVNTLYILSFIFYIIPVAMVLSVQPWRPKMDAPIQVLSSVLFMLGGFFILMIFSTYWTRWAREVDPQGEILGQFMPLYLPSENNVLENIIHIFIGPVSEEIVFRLGILGVLSQRMSRGWAIFLSSILFVFAHIYVYSSVQMVPLFVFSVLACVTYIVGGLSYAILLHIILNSWPYFKENFYQYHAFLAALLIIFFSGLIVFLVRFIRLRKFVFGAEPIR